MKDQIDWPWQGEGAEATGTMIISHVGRYCFVKTRKTAGTSIEMALAEHLGPDDWMSPLEEHGPRLRPQARNFVRLLRQRAPEFGPRNPHLPASVLTDAFAEDTHGYFTFCVERNPWDKAVSAFFWLASRSRLSAKGDIGRNFLEFTRGPRLTTFRDFDLYMRGGEQLVDRVLQYDRLEQDLRDVHAHHGVPELDLSAYRLKGGLRPDQSRQLTAFYGEDFGNEASDRVRAACAREIDRFGYEPPRDARDRTAQESV